MVLSSRQLNALHVNAVRTLIGAGVIATGLTVVAVYNLVINGPPQQQTINKDEELLKDDRKQ